MALIKATKKIKSGIRELDQLQDVLDKFMESVRNVTILDGAALQGLELDGSNVLRVEHGLGRPPRGYIITKRDNGTVVYDEQASNSRPDLFLDLNASSSVNVDIWVF